VNAHAIAPQSRVVESRDGPCQASPMSSQPSILLVDDERSILETLKIIFEREHYRVSTAASCAEALSLLKNGHRFHAVITDLNMEEEDIGLKVVAAAVKLRPRPAVVICTGYPSLDNSRHALDLGVDYMAHKPVELTELISALNRLVSRARMGASRK
jgi:DNA-binding NtrC family response regulator